MSIEQGNYIKQDTTNELLYGLDSLDGLQARAIVRSQKLKYNLDKNINPELDKFLSDGRLDRREIKALKEIFEHNKTGIINISKKNLKRLRIAIVSNKKQNYVGDSEKNTISKMDSESNIIKNLQGFNGKLEDSFKMLTKLDKSIENVEDISEKLKETLILFLEDLKGSISNFRAIRRRLPAPIISGINDLLGDLINGKGLFKIEDKRFQEELSKIVIEKERISSEEILNKTNSDFLLTIDKLDKSINSNSKVVLIGISDYNDDRLDLNQAPINDINMIKKEVMQIYGIPESNIILIKNKDATKANILKKIQLMSHNSKGGTLVYYSGHGDTLDESKNHLSNIRGLGMPNGINNNEHSYIIPTDAKFDANLHDNNYISAEELSDALEGKGLVITDMCKSGDFIEHLDSDINGIGATNNGVAIEGTSHFFGMGKFTYNFTKALLKNGGDLNKALYTTVSNTSIQKEVVKVGNDFYRTQ